MTRIMAFLGCLFLTASVFAAPDKPSEPMWPGVNYQQNIPTVKQVLGYDMGQRISNHRDMLRYFEALKKAAPDRIEIVEYARSWQDRALIYAVVASPENLAKLAEYEQGIQALSDPRQTDKGTADNIIRTLPASVWLEYAVHGNEISGTDAAMMTAYHLLAAPDEPVNKKILNNTLVFIDPLQNPDGRERFTSRYYASVGIQHSDDRLSVEQNEPWPRGRTNHYIFDMNRDWLALTQPESKGRVAKLLKYKPLVVVDLHEMGGDSSYYFAPAAKPINPHMTPTQIENMSNVGKNNARHFDAFGFDYFTREIFDAFYPGYGDSWPTFYGASAATYEVASARGERFRKRSGETFTYRDTVQQHFVASISTAEAVSMAREKLLQDFYDYQVSAIEQGKRNEERVYLLPGKRDRAGTHKLVTLMAEHGVEVQRAENRFKVCGKNYGAGTYFIDTAQPRGRFVTTTFTEQVDMSDAFVKEQERRRERNLNDEIYDVTGWSLPLMFNLDRDTCDRVPKVEAVAISTSDKLEGHLENANAKVAYLVPWGDMAASRFLTRALAEGIKLKSADTAFVLDGKKRYPAGTLVVEVADNAPGLAANVAEIAQSTGAIVDGVDTSWVTEGPSFGSNKTVNMVAPNVAMAWDFPVRGLSAGNTRFVIERELGYPVTAIRAWRMKSADLSDYQVIILPGGRYESILGKAGADNLRKWVQNGGVLITMGQATRFVANGEYGLLDVKRENAYVEDGKNAKAGKKDKSSTVAGSVLDSAEKLNKTIQNTSTSPDFVAGVLANVEVDQEHWLTAGVNPSLVGLAYGSDIYTPIKLNSGKNLAWFADKDNVLASGYLWEENKAQLAYKPFLIHQPLGKGMVIAYTQEPTFRAYMDGLNVLLTNTIFRSAAHARPLR